MLHLNDLLVKAKIDPATTVVMFHRPHEPDLQRAFEFLAGQRPDLYNAYQSSHSTANVEASLSTANYLVSGINLGDGTIVFVGIYEQRGWVETTMGDLNATAPFRQLAAFGYRPELDPATELKHFDLHPTDHLGDLHGRLILGRPPGRGYRRLARTTTFPVLAILRESALSEAMPEWDELVLSWRELSVLPPSWRGRLSEWRGIYLITDLRDGKQYVGAAYGNENILGRWRDYAELGHGNNRDLRSRDPETFRFSILQRLSPDLDPEDVVRIENRWKLRLLSRETGLNAN